MKVENGKIIFESDEDLPPLTLSLGTTAWNRTGSWKYLEPYYQDLTPPCVDSCLVGNDIVTFMRMIDEGRYQEAALNILQHNPFPATLGRVCPHPCEAPCNRKEMGGAIAIQSAERFLGDYALEHGLLPELPEPVHPLVTVVGAGPSGLAAAYFLRLLGHQVAVIEAEEQPGGLLWSGIPPYRLPREVLAAELNRFFRLGITFRFGLRAGAEVPLDVLLANSGAVLLAIGQGQSRELGIPGERHPAVLDGIRLLRRIHQGRPADIGKRVLIVGGGNTALDCARSLLRLGHEVTVLYRRSLAEMPAFADEIQEAIEEGIQIEFLTSPIRVVSEKEKLLGLECIRMKLYSSKKEGRRKPMPVPGTEYFLPADTVIRALGETTSLDLLPDEIRAAEHIHQIDYMTPVRGLFACGDCLGSGGTVAKAISMGRESAYAVHSWLVGEQLDAPHPVEQRGGTKNVARFETFASHYFRRAAAPSLPVLDPFERVNGFAEVRGGLTEAQIRSEAARCFKCGTCTMCDNCRFFCPDNAVYRADDGSYRIKYEYCKGCMVCVEECPRGAIHQRRVEV